MRPAAEAAGVPAAPNRRRERPSPGLQATGAAVALLFAAPLAYLVVRNLRDPVFWGVVTSRAALVPLLKSVLLAGAVAGGATVIGTAAAWFVARTDVPARRLWRVLLPLPLVIPSFIGAFVLLAAFAPGGLLEVALRPLGLQPGSLRGFWGSFTVLTLFTYPYVYLLAQARFRQLPPSLEESARLLGRGPLGTFFTVVVPQARSAILAGSLLVFLYTVSDFGVVQLLRYNTLTRSIYATRLFDRPASLALSLLLALLALGVVALERAVAGRRTVRSPRGTRPLEMRLGGWRPAAFAFLGGLVTLSLIVPVGVLAWWAVRGAARGAPRT
ncbi:MAG TPA: ABC transporter permease subunit, partial [Actinomycetota bacterium]|nr:ABC transporter permease subunit [Actinomycetota bacterium]